MNVVIYARAASPSESRATIDKQVNACMKFAEDNGYVVVGQYADAGITRAHSDQSEFMRMVGDFESMNAQGVLISSLNRFSRKQSEAMEAKAIIDNLGIETLSVIGTDMPDKVMKSLMDVYTELAVKKRKPLSQVQKTEACSSN